MLAGLITLALVGMLQSLGALADTAPVDPTWRSDAAGEDERGHAAGRGPASPGAIGPAGIRAPRRGEPTLDIPFEPAALDSSVRLRSRPSRAPPAPLFRASL
jgi:hypothetical protein